MYRIMLVDDEENILNALVRVLRRNTDWEIEIFSSGAEGLKRARSCQFDLFVSDYRMPNMNGIEFLSKMKELHPQAARIILSGYTDLEALVAGINQAEIYRFVNKPWNDYELIAAIGQALTHQAMLAENERLANEVREQRSLLDKQNQLLQQLEAESPGITKVDWAEDGSINL